MSRIALILLFLFSCASTLFAAEDDFPTSVAPILQRHCFECHSGSTPKGEFKLETLTTDFAANAAAWNGVLDRLTDGSMPPKGRPRPTADERKIINEWIASGLATNQKRQAETEGRARIRRLNRIEYANTLRDLLGAEVDIEQLPEDGVAAGFDNVDAALDLSSSLLESYLETIDAALDVAFIKGPRPESVKQHIEMVPLAKQITKNNRPMPRYGESTVIRENEIIYFSESMASKPLLEARAPVTGRYRFRVSANAVNHGKRTTILAFAGNYGMGVQGLITRPVAMFDVADLPTVAEFTVTLTARDCIRFYPHGLTNLYILVKEGYEGAGLAMQWVEMEGPIIDVWPPEATTRLLGEVDLKSATITDAETILRHFARRAFRRSVDAAELAPFVGLVKSRLEADYSFEEALRVGLKGILCSPNFLYLCATPGKLDDFDLATRLSYFLWSTTPDDALMETAERGELGRPDVLRREVERMLVDPKARAFTENFTGQWLSLRNLKATIPDKKLYPDFDDFLEWSMPRETYGFFEEILRNDRPVIEFLHSDWSILNDRLAALYGIPGVEGSHFRKVALPTGSHRGGVIAQAAVLKVTANGTNTSPVVRGAWVLDHLLGTPAPPPPKDVPAIEPDIRGAKTIREQLTKHRSIESCAACHAMIDPPGNALENFDVIGGWREFYRVVADGGKNRAKIKNYQGNEKPVGVGPSVDAADQLPDGRKFADIDEYKQILLADPDRFARGLTEKLLIYATGHRLEFADRETITAVLKETKSKQYGLRTLVHAVVQSPTFRSK